MNHNTRDGFSLKSGINRAFESYKHVVKYSTVGHVRISLCFTIGAGREEDQAKAVDWFTMVTGGEEPEAFKLLATCYAKGLCAESLPQ